MENLRAYLFYDYLKPNPFVPYLSAQDFDGLKEEAFFVVNPKGQKIACYRYEYETKKGGTILFLPGVGPGHKAYLREIEAFAKRGYTVYSLDYAGCGNSEGDGYASLCSPTEDALSLLEKIGEEVVLMGHSLGGFTSLNVLHLKNIKKAVCLSGCYTMKWYSEAFKNAEELRNHDAKICPEVAALDNLRFLKDTTAKVFFVHSKDDPIVPYTVSTKVIETLQNPNFTFQIVNGRGHNPNYTDDAIAYMNSTLSTLFSLTNEEEMKAYMADKTAMKMTEQDEALLDEIDDFIKA